MHAVLLIDAMEGPEAAAAVEAALRGVAGVERVRVDPAQNAVTVYFHADEEVEQEALLAALDEAGYPAERIEMGAPGADPD